MTTGSTVIIIITVLIHEYRTATKVGMTDPQCDGLSAQ